MLVAGRGRCAARAGSATAGFGPAPLPQAIAQTIAPQLDGNPRVRMTPEPYQIRTKERDVRANRWNADALSLHALGQDQER